jgi:UDP-N-acetylglucosamine 1-carboxyvinyltransferase
MDFFRIQGGDPLAGSISVAGAKNAVLPILAAGLLTDGTLEIPNSPRLRDVRTLSELLEAMGCAVERQDSGAISISGAGPITWEATWEQVRQMRASICVLGPLVGRFGRARVSLPGGCVFGVRPIDVHLKGLRALGAEVRIEAGFGEAWVPERPGGSSDLPSAGGGTGFVDLPTGGGGQAPPPATEAGSAVAVEAQTCAANQAFGRIGGRLKGAEIFLGTPAGPTVTGTMNVLMAATLAEGRTIIHGAACEPEVGDLVECLNAMGAKITGKDSPTLTIDGVEALHGATHDVIPDRIEAGTYLMAGAICGSRVRVTGCVPSHLSAPVDALQQAGYQFTSGPDWIEVQPRRQRPVPVDVTTQPYPGFPTDLQAQMMALMALADGTSVITDRIYPDRYMHLPELLRLGARIRRQGATAIIEGVPSLSGAPVTASDLRASAALVLAGLVANGETSVHRVYHIDRGYERIDAALAKLGGRIERLEE